MSLSHKQTLNSPITYTYMAQQLQAEQLLQVNGTGKGTQFKPPTCLGIQERMITQLMLI